ncbi:hypothetical protein ACRARG_13125 [Pseudooceanicola sp. C21-150M6]|uniref:hypothetical protein n=1 Tax=Pseudooceanicola sp. C21-150M6 TaxID=3434355 RepID=UPI003D7FE30D
MTTITPEIRTVTYNPASRAFEARVTITDAGEVYTYPCALRASLDLEMGSVKKSLAEMAMRRHSRDHRGLRSHRPENVLAAHVPTEVMAATEALWQRLLGRAA